MKPGFYVFHRTFQYYSTRKNVKSGKVKEKHKKNYNIRNVITHSSLQFRKSFFLKDIYSFFCLFIVVMISFSYIWGLSKETKPK